MAKKIDLNKSYDVFVVEKLRRAAFEKSGSKATAALNELGEMADELSEIALTETGNATYLYRINAVQSMTNVIRQRPQLANKKTVEIVASLSRPDRNKDIEGNVVELADALVDNWQSISILPAEFIVLHTTFAKPADKADIPTNQEKLRVARKWLQDNGKDMAGRQLIADLTAQHYEMLKKGLNITKPQTEDNLEGMAYCQSLHQLMLTSE